MSEQEQQLINIAVYCDSMMVKYGKILKTCKALYSDENKNIEFYIIYDYISVTNYKHFKYIINECNFMITDTEVLVNRDTINIINQEVDKRLNIKTEIYGR